MTSRDLVTGKLLLSPSFPWMPWLPWEDPAVPQRPLDALASLGSSCCPQLPWDAFLGAAALASQEAPAAPQLPLDALRLVV
jgi:hypothetical protein